MKNTTKNTKTILFASLIAAMILPFSGMNFADAKTDEIGKDIIKKGPKNSDIPLFNEREALLKKYDSLQTESDKADIKKQVDAMTEQIQAWHDERFDQAKYDEFVKAKKLLQTNLDVLKVGKGDLEAYEILPWVSRSFDYENNALEIRIQTKYFTEENIPKYIKTIRSIVGDKIDLTVGPGEPVTAEACTSRATGQCEPIKGGVQFSADDLKIGTVGFKVTYNSKTGFVTAGHTFVNDAGYQMGGTIIKQNPYDTSDIGNKIAMNLSKGVPTWCDCAVVEENSLFRSMSNGVYDLATPTSTENPYWNQLVTISGGLTGLSSGYVSSLNWDYSLDLDKNGTLETPINDAIKAGYSSQQGDSGSPIISYSGKLVGIHVGSGGVFMSHSAVTNAFPGLTWGF